MMDVNTCSGPAHDTASRIFNIGVTGHRHGNASFDANHQRIEGAVSKMLASINGRLNSLAAPECAQTRIITNMAQGCDLMVAKLALGMKLPVFAPLPFGRKLNAALNLLQQDWAGSLAVAGGREPQSESEQRNWNDLSAAMAQVSCFALADEDALLTSYLQRLAGTASDAKLLQEFENLVAKRTRAASLVTVEQSDVLLAIWDGVSPTARGGTRDTMAEALAAEVPVIWIDARDPDCVHWLDDPADLTIAREKPPNAAIDEIVGRVCECADENWSAVARAEQQFRDDIWQPRSKRRFHAYRRIERMFGGDGNMFGSIRQTYEAPQDVAAGSARPALDAIASLPQSDPEIVETMRRTILPRFAFADGISTYLSDAYRGGMVASFLLSAAAILAGLAYLPLVGPSGKWPFALLELILLLAIVAITIAGVRGQWHQQWFRTRRAAEYLRQVPVMVMVGCIRPKGHWPKSRGENWPELYARHAALGLGLPRLDVTQAYLKQHLETILRPFVIAQRDYHTSKAVRLEKVHHNLDRMSETLFVLAILSVGTYLALKGASALGLIAPSIPTGASKWLTFLGVAFPTLGAAIAGIRYFGDFERFASISGVTSEKLDRLIRRSDLMLAAPESEISYVDYSALAHTVNDVMIEEIERWQSIFGTKRMSVPV